MPPFGAFSPFCSSPLAGVDISSPLPHCNILFSALLGVSSPAALSRLFPRPIQIYGNRTINDPAASDPASREVDPSANVDDPLVRAYLERAGTGVGVACDVGRAGVGGSLGDIAQIVVCGACVGFVLWLASVPLQLKDDTCSWRRTRIQGFAVTLIFKILTTGNVLQQGSAALSVTSSIHLGLLSLMAWILLVNASVAFQLLEDGSPSALLVLYAGGAVAFTLSAFFALDQAFGISELFAFEPGSASERDLVNEAMMVLGLLWPYTAVVVYFLVMAYVVYFRLRETRPLVWFTVSFLFFAAGQAAQFLASQPLCKISDARLTAGFLNTLLETVSSGMLFVAWRSITEDDWYDDVYGSEEALKGGAGEPYAYAY
ncbi:hypothetical protein NliqN6_5381 [Naganishia liquefaciens]|uniref:Chitin synthase export chaperone n=1 Tax=Naganishia liquefaciens TaxID=104408 RepID=A0A8H3TXM3_9TREE|nr:hypothetical protein NliqN6_5381 [Naganishia liquefaciens]